MAKLPPGQTLQTTALVHEAYLRLAGDRDHSWDGRGHFFFAAARAMRDIIVEDARRKGSLKRGGGRKRIGLEPAGVSILPPTGDVLGVNEAVGEMSGMGTPFRPQAIARVASATARILMRPCLHCGYCKKTKG